MERQERQARDWLALQCAGALRPQQTLALLRRGLGPRAALARLPASARPSQRRLRAAERGLERAGARLLTFGSAGYPERLAVLEDAPPVLAVRGDASALGARAVAVVGSRAATAYGLAVAARLSADLARAGVVIVSGLAFGIDAAAHRAALEAGGRSVAVQACGLDHVYPAAHRRLAERIAAQGALLSEFAPGVRPLPAYFPLRNRLISGLAEALVVVEARERSGSLVTARHAAAQSVEVFAVPGSILEPGCAGSNGLLRDGAWPLLDASDVLRELAWPRAPRARRAPDPAAPGGEAGEILEVLRHAPASADALAQRLGRTPAQLAPALLELELAGCAACDRDGRWRALG